MNFYPSLVFSAAVSLTPVAFAEPTNSGPIESNSPLSQQHFYQQATEQETTLSGDDLLSQSASFNELGYHSISTNSSFEELRIAGAPDSYTDFYSSPYRVSLFNPQNGEDSERLWSQTKSIFAYGVGVAGVLALMPESITNWEKDDIKLMNKWWDNVRAGPVWDRDDFVINYIGHPYFGGVYYQAARKSGYRQWDAFMYSALMSTFYWEYGIEAFAEIPSIQDLVVTPTLGWVYGEWAFNKEKEIRLRGGTVWGSDALGSTALFFLDPVDSLGRGVNNVAGREVVKAGTGFVGVHSNVLRNGEVETKYQMQVQYAFGAGDTDDSLKRRQKKNYTQFSDDPVTYGIVGLSAGFSYPKLDKDRNLKNDFAPAFTLGLYFTEQFSTRLGYMQGNYESTIDNQKHIYENYSLDIQYYLLPGSTLKPYLNAGVGEAMIDKNRDTKKLQWNIGTGIHYSMNANWSLQADWKYAYHRNSGARDHLLGTRLIYRFGEGDKFI
ncbi:DUF3943 domain-containing protein [Vibrio hangzhouensis]|uniref:Outer membrane protein beta-barrel domain-containing protein n=1 Tax=Vibrio hangzhouensis TaxID=462991 RepID=A0A1H5WVN5_9VIBR|nr:DUF3943 domain-containing protein [Vibrio hangzhouensis]SEG03007.1 Outer membrane protein beta-barrel domain-containing protein [Vibrio hangzhouensis]